ncbi:MAG TPA: beta-ketoacyl-[acyl-carrier-protein] synthase family protein [Vicinamibacterales bacterium]|nr:beta-ketoacyl-[acyl-carrier-protein] synthase family protein [Vicinamibacterales bacterium]
MAVTGIGCVTALGATREAVWSGLVNGRCGIGPVTVLDPAGYRSQLAAEIPETNPDGRFTALETRRFSRCDRIAVLAAGEAMDDAGLDLRDQARERAGVVFGAGTSDLLRNEGYLRDLRLRGARRARPSHVFNHFPSTPVDVVGERFGLRGLRMCIVAACSSSTIAIGFAGEAIRRGELDVAVAGGADVLCQLTFSGFNALRLVDVEPCRPFDAARAGMTIGEAAAVLVLEDFDRATRRGATIYAELCGYSATCEAFHPTSPEPNGVAVAATIRAALEAARVNAADVEHVNAHGTGTIHNDRAEAKAMARIFGERSKHLPVTSIKSMVGHCLGAAGAIEAAALALTISRGVIPPTANHTVTDPEFELDVVAPDARTSSVRCGVSVSLAFGGNDAALVMRKV